MRKYPAVGAYEGGNQQTTQLFGWINIYAVFAVTHNAETKHFRLDYRHCS